MMPPRLFGRARVALHGDVALPLAGKLERIETPVHDRSSPFLTPIIMQSAFVPICAPDHTPPQECAGEVFSSACELFHPRSTGNGGIAGRIDANTFQRRQDMKILLTALAIVTTVAAPAFAQKQAPVSPNAVV